VSKTCTKHMRMYDVLILDGGADKVVAYVGALDVLQQRYDLNMTVRTVLGCSAGALVGLMFCLGMCRAEMEDFILLLRPPDVPESVWHIADQVWQTWGILGMTHVADMVRQLLYMRLGMLDCSLCEFAQKTGKHLVVWTSNLSDAVPEFFSLHHNSDVSIVRLMCMTTCIPVLFKPVPFKDKLYVDGFVYAQQITREFVERVVHVHIANCLVLCVDCAPIRLPEEATLLQYISYTLNGLISAKNTGTLDAFAHDPDSTVIVVRCDQSHNLAYQAEHAAFSFLYPSAERVRSLSDHGAACAARALDGECVDTDAGPLKAPTR
jgi:hypothetical protein